MVITRSGLLLLLCAALSGCDGARQSGEVGSVCDSAYAGPAGDPFCEEIYALICVDGWEFTASRKCRTAGSATEAAGCRYCPAQEPGAEDDTGYSYTTCNEIGTAPSCDEGAPYSCGAAGACYGSLYACQSSDDCD